jgi:hypothetical protein
MIWGFEPRLYRAGRVIPLSLGLDGAPQAPVQLERGLPGIHRALRRALLCAPRDLARRGPQRGAAAAGAVGA